MIAVVISQIVLVASELQLAELFGTELKHLYNQVKMNGDQRKAS